MPMRRRQPLVPALLLVASVAGCSSSSAVATIPTPVKCQVTLAMPSQNIAADGGTGTLAVTTTPECPWDASTSADWLSGLSPASGQGPGTVEFRVAPNPQASTRQAMIVVNNSSFQVSQQAATCRFELQPTSLTVGAAGETRELHVSTGCAWTASTDASWITFTTAVRGNGDATVGFRVAPNRADGQRIGTISVGDQRSTVTQAGVAGAVCTFDLSPGGQAVSASGGTNLSFSVTAGSDCPWTATSSAAWLSVVGSSSGRGSGTVGFNVAANAGAARTGSITVGGTTTFAVTQAAAGGAACTYNLSSTSTSIAAAGGSGSITVSTGNGCAWTASRNDGWITVTSGANGSGNGSVGFTVAANAGGARMGTITVAGQTVSVTQAAAVVACTYNISPTSTSIAATGGSGSITVSTGTGCAWTASRNDGWITVTSGASGSGNGSVAFTVAANTGGARTGSISVAGQTFSVSQAAEVVACSYSISPANTSVGASGGSGNITVSAGNNCPWTAGSNAGWLTITSGSGGNGNGSIAYSVAANTGGSRSAAISVGGQTFTVTQAAAAPPPPCSYSLSSNSTSMDWKASSVTVNVSTGSGCAWTASSNASWITVTSGGSGSGNGSVAFNVSRNDEGDRTGTLTIAGQTFTVHQSKK